MTSIATEAAGAQGQQLRGSVAANFGEAATDWRKVRDEMDRRQADFSAKVQEKAKALQTSLGPLTNKITVGAQKISEIKRQLEAATSTDSIKKLRQDLVSKAQDLSLLADVAYSAILGKMTDEVTRLARPSDDLANFQAIDSARGGILDAAQEYARGMQTLVGDLGSLGINIPAGITSTISQGIQFASIANGFVSNLATGNYLGAILGIGGVFGLGGGPSPEMLMQQKILDGINKIFEGRQVIMRQLNMVLEGEQRILQYIADLSKQIYLNQQQVMAGLDNLNFKLDALSDGFFQ